MRLQIHAILISGLIAVSTVVHAQAATAQTAQPNLARSQNCAPTQAMPKEGTIAPRDNTTGQASEPLGDKLAKSDGVLCPPPGVDPEMHTPAPDTGKMPVIPPPGSPGGDPSVRPK